MFEFSLEPMVSPHAGLSTLMSRTAEIVPFRKKEGAIKDFMAGETSQFVWKLELLWAGEFGIRLV